MSATELTAIDLSTERDVMASTIEEAMHRGVIVCSRSASLAAVAELMARHRVHSVVVADDPEAAESLWGVVSDLDLVSAAAVRPLDEQTAGASAATAALTISPAETLQRAGQLMTEYGTAHLIVVDPDTLSPIGVVSTLDIATALSSGVPSSRPEGSDRDATIASAMQSPVVTCPPETTLRSVARALTDRRIHALVLTDGRRAGPCGIVTDRDVVRAHARGTLDSQTAGEAASEPTVTVRADLDLRYASELMGREGTTHLVVVAPDAGGPVGVVSSLDIARAASAYGS